MSVKKPEIIFLYPVYYNGHCLYHLGSAYIIAYLRQKGIRAEQFVNTRPLRLAELAEQILAKGAKILGFTCYDQNYFLIKLLVKYLKRMDPGIFIVAGGPTATFSDEVVLKNIPEIDLCVRGEGEFTAYELIGKLRNGRDFSTLKGITFRRAHTVVRNADNPLIQGGNDINAQLDILPSPYLSGVLDPAKFLANDLPISLVTSRGCIYKCTYCNYSAISRHTVRYHSIERVVAELTLIGKLTGHKNLVPITFEDDCFTLNKTRARQLCHRLIRNNLNNFRIDLCTRADRVNENMLKLLFKAGVREICFGLESASPKVLYNIRKARLEYSNRDNLEPEKKFIQNVEKSVGIAKKMGINIYVSIILGLPGENFKDGLTTINFVKKLGLNQYSHNSLGVFAGTELFKKIFKDNTDTSESRIKQSLPASQKMVHRYDVSRIPPCSNPLVPQVQKIKTVFLDSSLSLSGSFWDAKENGHRLEIILTGDQLSVKNLINSFPTDARISFGKNLKSLFGKKAAKIKISNLYLADMIRPPADGDGTHSSIAGLFNKIRKGHYQFEKFSCYDDHLKSATGGKNIIFGIMDSADIDTFEKLLARMQADPRERHINAKNNCILLDACRWSRSCPAREPKRLIIGEKHAILPCFHGKTLGALGSDLNEVRNAYRKYREREAKKRGCEDCPVRESCSQCPFLGGMDYLRYCAIKRNYSGAIDKFIFLLQFETAVRAINYAG